MLLPFKPNLKADHEHKILVSVDEIPTADNETSSRTQNLQWFGWKIAQLPAIIYWTFDLSDQMVGIK